MGVLSDAAVSDGNFLKRQAENDRQIAANRTARTLEHSSIGADGLRLLNGGSLIVEGGRVVLRNPDGVEIAFFGDVIQGETTSRGWIFRFDTGNIAFALGGSPGDQFWSFRDESGNVVLSNDAISSVGLARPHLNYHLITTEDAESGPTYMWPSTTSATPVAVIGGVNSVWHPKVTIGVNVLTDGGGTGHWSLSIGGTTVIADETTFGIHTVDIPDWGTVNNPDDQLTFLVSTWASGTATRSYVQVDRIFAQGS